MSLFTNKTLMITGGTGSFGNAVLNRFLGTDIGEIRIFSRDEKKQDDMRHEFQAKMPAVDMGNFYRVPADNRGLNYDKYFKEGDEMRNTLTEFNSNNTRILNVEETKAKIAALSYIQDELKKRNA